jgi:hypothetical protein
MFGCENGKNARSRTIECATRQDFRRIFSEDMSALHTLAFLLTADGRKAERCFVAGLDESVDGNPVFRQWARSWSKRAIIRNAVKLMTPSSGDHDPPSCSAMSPARNEQEALIHRVIKLPPFERFVFVISVLEGHSLSDSASLLGCTTTELAEARARALEQLAQLGSAPVPSAAAPSLLGRWFARSPSANSSH